MADSCFTYHHSFAGLLIPPRTLSSNGLRSGAMHQGCWATTHTRKSKVRAAFVCLNLYHVLTHTATIRELGEFYRRNGQRARLPKEVGQSLLDRLGVAAAALPDKDERSLLDRLLKP